MNPHQHDELLQLILRGDSRIFFPTHSILLVTFLADAFDLFELAPPRRFGFPIGLFHPAVGPFRIDELRQAAEFIAVLLRRSP